MTLRLSRAGVEVAGREIRLSEYEPLDIEILTGREIRNRPDVLLDGASIGSPDVTVTEAGLRWHWKFRSESWCGRATLSVVSDHAPVDLNVRAVPSGQKYSEDEYERMIDEVLAFGANLPWGLAPGESAGSVAANEKKLGATHPALIHHYMSQLLEQLARVLRDPVMNQRRIDIIENFRPTRVAVGSTLTWLASRPGCLQQIKSGDLHVVVPQQVRRENYDHPANRYVLTLVKRLRLSFESTSNALLTFSRGQFVDDLERHRAELLASRVRNSANQLRHALAHPVLRDLTAGEMTEGVTQVFGDHPAYGRFAKLARRLLDGGVRIDRFGDLAASMRRSWDMFEIYCLYKVVNGLERALGKQWAFDRRPLTRHVLSGPPEGQYWSASHPDGRRWVLFYQQWFRAGEVGPFTVSTTRKPDFVLAAFAGAKLERWTLLDAKYRTAEASIHEALQSMHVYRDSLRWGSEDTGAVQMASAGYLLVPHVAEKLERFATQNYLRRWGIGLLRIGDDAAWANLLASSTGCKSE